MSITYTLHIASEASPQDATNAMRRPVSLPSKEATGDGNGLAEKSWFPDGSVVITAWRLAGGFYVHDYVEEHCKNARLGVSFDKRSDRIAEGHEIMLRDLQALFEKIPGDAILNSVGD